MMDERLLSRKISSKTFLNFLDNRKIEDDDMAKEAIEMELAETSAMLQEARTNGNGAEIMRLRDKQRDLRRKRRSL
ncbi:MAG: hypothetical protein LBG12_11965 [Synergistaceae bacterium]|jgi:hypothetical protein|nr:hypothetical protein [Synergistaceae bacterium]